MLNCETLFSQQGVGQIVQHPVGQFAKQPVSQLDKLQVVPQLAGQLVRQSVAQLQDDVFRQQAVAQICDVRKPIGVSAYKLTHSLPKKIKSSLPSIKEIEKELGSKK